MYLDIRPNGATRKIENNIAPRLNFNYIALSNKGRTMKTIELLDNWTFRQKYQGEWKLAQVPGCIHTDLMQNNVIEDPFFRDNETDVQWIGYKKWEYRTKFEVDAEFLQHDAIDLIFEGLDTFCDVYLNERLLLSADNMFHTWRLHVKEELKKGKNTLRLVFDSPIERMLPEVENFAYPAINDAGEKTSPFTRKAPYHFGWDWGPRLVTCGIWRPVKLVAWDGARFESVQVVQQELTSEMARLQLNFEIVSLSFFQAELTITHPNKAFPPHKAEAVLHVGHNQITADLEIPEPQLWWPNGYGEQPLYTLELGLHGDHGIEDQHTERVGLRTVQVLQQKDDDGKSFQFVINDVPIFAQGGNWIPADSFPSRVTKEQYRHLLQSCQQANMNMLRVWGGGIYENDEFYSLCDELGILVWQDFMFSCAMYPADESFLASVRLEAIDNIIRLRNHPSLALWCGNNEIEWGWKVWGLKDEYPAKLWDEYSILFSHVLPNVCQTYDPTRLYWPSSPSSNFEVKDSNSPKRGDMHYWGVWHSAEPFESYARQFPRFMSEYGFQSFPLLDSVRRFAEPGDYAIESPVMLQHQKHERGNQLIRDYMLRDYPEPRDFESFLYLSQIVQAEGIKLGTEHFRRISQNSGALYWQINDCWPVASWSSIDYYGTWKALHYYAKRFFAPILVSPVLNKNNVDVFVVSNSPKKLDATLAFQLLSFDANTVFESETPISIPPFSREMMSSLSLKQFGEFNRGTCFLVCRLLNSTNELSRNILFFEAPKNLQVPKPTIKWECRKQKQGFFLQLKSPVLARHVYLKVEQVEHHFSDNFFDLLPNESKAIHCSVSTKMSVEQFCEKVKVMSLYDVIM